ncbi:MAG: hypothetical protein IT561_22645 [Alphaproteobacteria bacterium]|nr:hypothetical protein [Alphaproteobacteria bacterium]
MGGILAASAQGTIDNAALDRAEFREHKATYGLVYRLPPDVTGVLDAKINGPLRNHLVRLGLQDEARTTNIPHVTVVHIHSADPTTPAKMLKALPKRPAPISLTLKGFYTTEAAKDAGHPWWLDLGIVKSGDGFESMMAYNTVATAALAPLRDGPLPRCTGPVYAKMGDAAKELVKTVGVSGVNVVKDGKELRAHNPHNTLVYSMTRFDPPVQAAMKEVAEEFNKALPDGIATTFRDVSIVEIGFSGNVLREFYRIGLEDGAAVDVATGKVVATIAN